MNDEHHERIQLELATARRLPSDAEMSAQTKELREGWLALTQALPPQMGDDTAAFAAQVARELTAEPVQPHHKSHIRQAAVVVGVIGATAAALLLALSIWMAREPGAREEIADGGQTKESQPNPAQAVLAEVESAWDDPLDDRIIQMQEDVARLRARGHDLDASLSALDQKLSELADDLDAGSL